LDILSFRRVTFSYNPSDREIIKDISLKIKPQAVTAFLGPNGAGKTTLLYLALGWLKLQQGEILLDRKPIYSFSKRERGQWMSLVPQSEHIPFEYSLVEYVLLGRAPYLKPLQIPDSRDYEIAVESLKRVGLGGMEDKAITKLSGGEKQLLLIARSLAQQPHILLLDEPASHLDLGNKGKLVSILKELVSRGVTILLTTHQPDLAAFIADQVVLMKDGKIVQSGPADEVITCESLSSTYGLKVKVVEVEGKRMIVWM